MHQKMSNLELFRKQNDSLNTETHNHFFPNEYPVVEVQTERACISCNVYDLSPEVIGVTPSESALFHFALGQETTVRLPESESVLRGVVISMNNVPFAGRTKIRIGIKFSISDQREQAGRPQRWCCPKSELPIAFYRDPYTLNKIVDCRIHDFSAAGLAVILPCSSVMPLPGTKIRLAICLPVKGQFYVNAEVANVRSSRAKRIMGCRFINPHDRSLTAIAVYLLTAVEGVTLRDLRCEGLIADSVENALHCSYVQTKEEWAQVLHLRLVAAQSMGRLGGCEDRSLVSDSVDRYARHIICRIGGRMVASIRIVFNNNKIERSEHHRLYHLQLADWLWREGFVEVSHACVHPEFRGSDIFMHLCRQIGRIAIQSGYRNILLNCEDSLVPVCQRMGARRLGPRFHSALMQDTALNLLYIDAIKTLNGRNVSILSWNLLFRSLVDFLSGMNQFKPNLLQKIGLLLYRAAGSLISAISDKLPIHGSMKKG